MDKYFDRVRIYDGSKGVKLSNCGALVCDQLNLTKPELVKDLYANYQQAGSEIIQTNTFNCNGRILKNHGLLEQLASISYQGVKLAKEVAGDAIKVAASIGPTGEYLLPYGDLDALAITEAYVPAIQVMGSADYLHFETFSDLHELRLVLLSAKASTTLPLLATMTFEHGSVTSSGNPADVCAYVMMRLGCVAVGVNCGVGPMAVSAPLQLMQSVCGLPLILKPNAGIPVLKNNQLIYDLTPEAFAQAMLPLLKLNVRLIGGCCGSDPSYIAALRELIPIAPTALTPVPSKRYLATMRHLTLIDEIQPEQIIHRSLTTVADFDQIMALELTTDQVLLLNGTLDFTWEQWNELAIQVHAPLIVRGSKTFIESALRYYPGIIGVSDQQFDQQLIDFYGGWRIFN